ncbi:acetyl-CoA carboxylase biotin carboxyl carrier protein (plasmid) [Pantoea sp. C3]|uniref:acetyl-CoA carboxylase biotin carboxyl carrier protein n=1 Tax=Pantoea phytostimulans TaxID=2769024 RepID=UPI0038F73BA2
MDINEMKELANLLTSPMVSEIEIQETTKVVRIIRQRTGIETQSEICASDAQSCIQKVNAVPAEPLQTVPINDIVQSTKDSVHNVASPMIGTFYRAPVPDAPPFIEVGQQVKADDIVCIIEAMKMMHQVPAGKAGIIKSILSIDGDMVEFDQPLVTIS